MSKILTRWFEKRRETKAIRMIREHSEITLKTVENFRKEVREAFKGEEGEALKIHNRITLYEKELDSIRRLIIDELARGELPPSDRGDLMRLARQIDWVADWAHESSRILKVLLPRFKEIMEATGEISDIVLKMTDKVFETAENLKETIDKLMQRNITETLNYADKVERLEEDVDGLYEKAREQFSRVCAPWKCIPELILLSQLIDSIENIADRCEDTTDQIRVIAVSMA